MNSVDIRLKQSEIELLKSMVGHRLIALYHDAFVFTNTSSEIVQVEADNLIAYLYSFVEPVEHFGSIEDTAIWTYETEKYPALDSKHFIKSPVQEIITKIELVQENQKLSINGEFKYNFDLTRAIIFTLESGFQIALQKDVWFSEEIIILKGYNLIDKINEKNDFLNESWGASCVPESNRIVENISL